MSYFYVVLLVVMCGSTYVAVCAGAHVHLILLDQYTLAQALVGTYKKLYEHRRGTSICDGALGGV